MKRMIMLLLACLLLCACLPTPEQEFVVNKGDSTVEDKINAAPKPEAGAESEAQPEPAAAQFFPDRWDEDAVQLSEHVRLSVHADVVQKSDGLYPVYRLKDAPLTDEDARAFAEKLLDTPAEAYTSERTKADYQKDLQAYLDDVAEWQRWVDAGKPDWGDRDESGYTQEEIDEQTAWYMERIKAAPDVLETKPVSDYSGLHLNSATVYTMQSGEKAYVYFYQWGFGIAKDCAYYGHTYTESDYRTDREFGESNAKLWHEVTMDRADAEAILNTELDRLGLTEYSVSTAEKACFLERSTDESMRYKTNGWSFKLIRNPASYPVSGVPWSPSQDLNYGTDEGFVANAPVWEEHLNVFIDENGVQSFTFSDRKAVSGMPNANVELLPFSDIQRIAKNTFTMCLRYDLIGENDVELEVYRALLTTFTLRAKDSDEYYEMPCWVLFFDGLYGMGSEEARLNYRENSQSSHDALVLNAIDGSVVHTDYGY